MKELMESAIKLMGEVKNEYKSNFLGTSLAQVALAQTAHTGVIQTVHKGYDVLEKTEENLNHLQARFGKIFDEAKERGWIITEDVAKDLVGRVCETEKNLTNEIEEGKNEVKQYIENYYNNIGKEIKNVTNKLQEYNEQLKIVLNDIQSTAFDTKTNTTEIINKLENLEEQVLNDVETLKNSFEIYTNNISEKYKEISSVLEELQSKVSALKDILKCYESKNL